MRILISACLLGARCRYDGVSKLQPWISDLAERHILVPVCPEQLGGLPTPRPPAERLPDGRVVTGKNSSLLGPSAALLLNAIKALAGIDKELDLLPSSIIAPISDMKISHLGHRNPRLHSDEVLIALSISAVTNPLAERVLKKLDDLRGCDAHFSVIISEEDEKLYKRLGIHVSCQPRYEIKRLYHK